MTTEGDFLAAIHAAPQDATTLLVFADWLDDRDDPRAGFLRDLVVWRRLPDDERLDRTDDLNHRLTEGPLAAWTASLRRLGELEVASQGLLALWLEAVSEPAEAIPVGWVTQIHAEGTAGLRALTWLRRVFPESTRVTLNVSSAEVPSAAGTPFTDLAAVDEVTIDAARADLALLTELPARFVSPRLSAFRLTLDRANDDHLDFLAAQSWAARLTELDLDEGEVSNAGIAALSEGRLERLAALSLRGTRIGDDAAERLTQARHFPSLRRLQVESTEMRRRGLLALLCSPLDLEARYLDLDLPTLAAVLASGRTSLCGRACCLNCPRPAGRFWLGEPGHALHLTAHSLESLQSLGTAPDNLEVRQLWMRIGELDDDLPEAIRRLLPHRESITTLGLIGTTCDSDQAGCLGELFPAVTRLGLVNLPQWAVQCLASAPLWSRLTAIGSRDLDDPLQFVGMLPESCRSLTYFEDRAFHDEEIALLAALSGTDHLEELDIRQTWLTETGALALARGPHLRRLRRLLVSRRDEDGVGIPRTGPTVTTLRERFAEVIVA